MDNAITREALEQHKDLFGPGDTVLFKTRNSNLDAKQRFYHQFVYLAEEGAKYLAERGERLKKSNQQKKNDSAPPRFELGSQEPKSCMLPLHHRAQLTNGEAHTIATIPTNFPDCFCVHA